jgi:hypothetical protein
MLSLLTVSDECLFVPAYKRLTVGANAINRIRFEWPDYQRTDLSRGAGTASDSRGQ